MDNTSPNIQPAAPLPDQHKGKGALDAFLNLLSLVTLGWMAFSFGAVVFQIINKFFSASVFGYDSTFYSRTLRFSVASLIIVTPVFFTLTGLLHKQYKEGKLSNSSGIHKWLTYIMLFIAFCNIVGSLIAIVFRFLDGEFFSAVILKSLTVLLIAAGIFGYYWYDLRRQNYQTRSQVSMITTVLTIVLVIGAIIGGFIIAGSPQLARKINYDNQRVNDLSNLRYQIEEYYRNNQKLPADLSEPRFSLYKDPETKSAYEYVVVDAQQYDLCATFALAANASGEDRPTYYYGGDDWSFHQAGYQCFHLNVKTVEPYGKPIPAVPID